MPSSERAITPRTRRACRQARRPAGGRGDGRSPPARLAYCGRCRPTTAGCTRLLMDARILLVEDDPSIREVTAIGLRAAGFEVEAAADGAAGLERWLRDSPDLVLLDVMLPRLDGLEVCREIRRDSTVPIVMLTARGDTIDVVVGLEAGADDYVRKPFEMPELVARIRAALRRKRGTGEADASALLQLGSLTIDTAGRTVRRDADEIALTRTEFDLLVEL